MTDTEEGRRSSTGDRVWRSLGILADVSAVLAVATGPGSALVAILGIVALLTGIIQLVVRRGKPLDRWTALGIVSVVAGAVALTIVVDRAIVSQEQGSPQQTVATSAPSAHPQSSSPSVTTGQVPPHSLRLVYPDPNAEVTNVPHGIRVKVEGQVPEGYFVWTGARAINKDGNPTEPHSSLLSTIEEGPNVWKTETCFGLGTKSEARLIVYAYLVPEEAHKQWPEDKKKSPGVLRKSDDALNRDGVTIIGKATVQLTDETQCIA